MKKNLAWFGPLLPIFGAMFTYRHLVQFYETDLMGIVHHSNYLRFCEEARVAWAHDRGLIDFKKPESASYFAVLETRVRHIKPARFGELVEVNVQAERDGVRLKFQYRLRCGDEIVALAETHHVPLNESLRPMRWPQAIKTLLEKERWTETWLSNS